MQLFHYCWYPEGVLKLLDSQCKNTFFKKVTIRAAHSVVRVSLEPE